MKVEVKLIYCPCPDVDSAKVISRILLESKVILCANIFPEVSSLYWWNEEIQESHESILIIKCRSENVETITKKIEELHPYDVPAILNIDVSKVNLKYFTWINSE